MSKVSLQQAARHFQNRNSIWIESRNEFSPPPTPRMPSSIKAWPFHKNRSHRPCWRTNCRKSWIITNYRVLQDQISRRKHWNMKITVGIEHPCSAIGSCLNYAEFKGQFLKNLRNWPFFILRLSIIIDLKKSVRAFSRRRRTIRHGPIKTLLMSSRCFSSAPFVQVSVSFPW